MLPNEEKLKELKDKLEEERKQKEDIFDVKDGDKYYHISSKGKVIGIIHRNDYLDNFHVANFNACKDKEYMEKLALKEKLNRVLEQYSYQHGGDKIDWKNDEQNKYYIEYDWGYKNYNICCYKKFQHQGTVYFISIEIAEQALEKFKDLFDEVYGLK